MRRCAAVLALASLACPVLAQDAASQAQLIGQQQSDAFALQLQQSIQSFRAGPLSPAQRLELESLQRDQRLRQADGFYRQQVQQSQTTTAPAAPGAADAALMRFKQENAADVSRARDEAAHAVERGRPLPKPAPNPEPAVVWGPALR